MKAFKAYDIRGVYNKDFNKSDALKTANYLAQVFQPKKVLIGRDVRKSSDEIFEALCSGFTQAGVDVDDAGLTTTPMVYYLTAAKNYELSVMITASHNSAEYNGMKVSGPKASPIGLDSGLNKVKDLYDENTELIKLNQKGNVKRFDFRKEYLYFLQKYISDHSNLKMAVDCSNGMAGFFIKDLLGDSPYYINETPDGSFPGHDPNPLIMKNVEQLQKLTLEKNCDMGIIFDGDADRVMFVDERGAFIPPDLIIALMGHYFLEGKEAGQKVLQDIRSSKAVGEYLGRFGAEMHTWRVGRAYAALKLREIGALYGGELAGHYYFRDFFYSDSGLMAALIVISIVSRFHKEGKTFSQLISDIRAYVNSGEINYSIERKKEAMEAIKDHFAEKEKATRFMDFDGYRLEFRDWWFNVRPSNTEPYLRFIAEAKDPGLLEQKLHEVEKIIKQYS